MKRSLMLQFEALKGRYHRKSKACLRAIDVLFAQFSQRRSLGLKDGFAYAKLILPWSFTRFELHISALVILLLVLNTGMFVPIGATGILTRISVVSASLLLGTGISFTLMFLVLPLHIWRGASLWSVAVLHASLGALVLSVVAPVLLGSFQNQIVPGFSDIFVPLLLLFGLTDAFVLWQTQRHICYNSYKQHHKADNLAALLPAEKRGAILRMSAADHYVEFFTERGSHLRRMTMKAAMEKADTAEGIQVHRSHWVAYSAMQALERDGERRFLTLRDGSRVPVSRRKVRALRAMLEDVSRIAAQ